MHIVQERIIPIAEGTAFTTAQRNNRKPVGRYHLSRIQRSSFVVGMESINC